MGLVGSLDDDATPSVHPEAWIAPGAVVVGRVTLGRSVSVWYGSVLRADDDEIVVGAECNIQDLCCLHVDEGEPVVLEERVSVGHHATVHGASVGAGALIGIGAIVLGRSRIGAGSLVAAGTVVRPGAVVPAGRSFRWRSRKDRPGTDRRGPAVVRDLGHQVRRPGGAAPWCGLAGLARQRRPEYAAWPLGNHSLVTGSPENDPLGSCGGMRRPVA